MSDIEAISRTEQFYENILGEHHEITPISREEIFLNRIAEAVAGGSANVYTKAETDTLLTGKVDWESIGVLGAKNLLPYPYTSVISETYQDVTIAVDNDGVVTLNGTSLNAFSSRRFCYNLDCTALRGKTCIVSGCPSGGDVSTYRIGVTVVSAETSTINAFDTGDGITITFPSDAQTLTIYLSIASGVTFNDTKFYPMLRLANDTDSTYQPYAKTNKQLTDEITNKANSSDFAIEVGRETIDVAVSTGSSINYVKYGRLVILSFDINLTQELAVTSNWTHLATLTHPAITSLPFMNQVHILSNTVQNIINLRASGNELYYYNPSGVWGVSQIVRGQIVYIAAS